VQPSVSKSDHARYDELRRKLRRERGTINSARRSSSAENLAAEPASNKRVRPGDDDDRDDRDAPELATS
jgi:hypothetical protein